LVAVVGASGSGKSSLVFAGLQPRLKSEGWLIEDCRPGSQPFYSLAEAFVRLLEPEVSGSLLVKQASDLSELIQQRGIGEVVASLTHKYVGRSLLIVVDQFEELFTLCEKEQRERFLGVVLDGLTKAVGLKLIVTLRADFCGQVYGDRTLTDAFQDAQLLVGPMNSTEFQAAIEQPAKLSGLELEPGLTDRLLQDVGQEPGNLPLLEFALMQLWERQENGRLTHQAHTAIKGVKGALAQHADQVYARLSREQQQVPQVFTKLVRLGVGTEDTRRVATRSEIENWNLVTVLANERLVVTGRDEQRQEDTVEVIHEALIREWKQLQQWVDENRHLRQLIQTIEDERQIWLEEKQWKNLLDGRLLKDAQSLVLASDIRKSRIRLRIALLNFNRLLKIRIWNSYRQRLQLMVPVLQKRIDIPKEIQSFIRKSLIWRRLQMTGFLLLPVLTLGIPAEYFWREESIKRDYSRIQSQTTNTIEERSAVFGLAGGCWAKEKFGSPSYLWERIFSNCRLLNYADLRNADLSFMNLSDADLNYVNLSKSYLLGTDLTASRMFGANLSGAFLQSAILSGVKLPDANLRKANLHEAHLGLAPFSSRIDRMPVYTILDNADLRDADLSEVNLIGSSLQKTDLRAANLNGATLRRVNLTGADLSNANLEKIKFACLEFKGGRKQCSNLKDIKWNEQTNWKGIQGWETVENIPPALEGV
jgi:uncharacterized protein YjbI with pentapeptide repeats/predicted Zn-dependent protease with MMP-like domain